MVLHLSWVRSLLLSSCRLFVWFICLFLFVYIRKLVFLFELFTLVVMSHLQLALHCVVWDKALRWSPNFKYIIRFETTLQRIILKKRDCPSEKKLFKCCGTEKKKEKLWFCYSKGVGDSSYLNSFSIKGVHLFLKLKIKRRYIKFNEYQTILGHVLTI